MKITTKPRPQYRLVSTHDISWYPHSIVTTKGERIAQFISKRHANKLLEILQGKKP